MKKFITISKFPLASLLLATLCGCGSAYNSSYYTNGIYGSGSGTRTYTSSKGTTTASASVVNALDVAANSNGNSYSKGSKLSDSLAAFLNDSTYVAADTSYEAKLKKFDKEKYEKPQTTTTTVVNNYYGYNPWNYACFTYSWGWWEFRFAPFYNPWWGWYWRDPIWWHHPYYPWHPYPYHPWGPGSGPWRPYYSSRPVAYGARGGSAWSEPASGGRGYGVRTGSTVIRGAEGVSGGNGRSAYSNVNMDGQTKGAQQNAGGSSTTAYRRVKSYSQSINESRQDIKEREVMNSGGYIGTGGYSSGSGNVNGGNGGYTYRRTGRSSNSGNSSVNSNRNDGDSNSSATKSSTSSRSSRTNNSSSGRSNYSNVNESNQQNSYSNQQRSNYNNNGGTQYQRSYSSPSAPSGGFSGGGNSGGGFSGGGHSAPSSGGSHYRR